MLDQLANSKCKQNAQMWLNAVHEQVDAVASIKSMCKYLNIDNFALSDVTTRKNDMELILRNYYKSSVMKWLNAACGQGHADNCIKYMREQLQLGNLTLSDIGTSEEKLAELSKKSA